jgi:hypothetical protein
MPCGDETIDNHPSYAVCGGYYIFDVENINDALTSSIV